MVQSNKGSQANESPNGEGKQGYGKINWANVYLDSNQKEAAKLLGSDFDRVESYIQTLLTDGYSLSSGFNEKTDSFIVTIIGKSCPNSNLGWAMTTHAGTWYDALCRALFKHFVLGQEFTYAEMNERFGSNMP